MLDLNYAACQRHSKFLCGWGSYFIFLFLQSEKDLKCCTLPWMRFQPGIKGHFSLFPSPLSPPLHRQPWMPNGETLAVGGGRAWWPWTKPWTSHGLCGPPVFHPCERRPDPSPPCLCPPVPSPGLSTQTHCTLQQDKSGECLYRQLSIVLGGYLRFLMHSNAHQTTWNHTIRTLFHFPCSIIPSD